MQQAQRIIILFLVLGLLVGLEVVLMSRCTGEETASGPTATPEPSADAEATPEPTPTVQPTMPGYTSPPGPAGNGGSSTSSSNNNTSSATRAPTPTQAPAPTQAPTPTPAPTTPPEPTTVPGTNISSGSFSSYTGVSLNLGVNWQAQTQGSGTVRIYITGTVSSYELHVMSLPVSISFGGYSTTVSGSGIDVGSGNMASSQLFSTYLDVPEGTSGTMTVSWCFNGTYSQTELGTITASDYVFT